MPYQTPCHISIPHSAPKLAINTRSAPGPCVTQSECVCVCPSMCVCLCMLLPSMPKGVLLCKGFPSTDMLYLTPRHNGDWSPPVQSGTAADRSHSCLPAFSTACVHQAPTSHCNADCWIRNKRPGMGPAQPHPREALRKQHKAAGNVTVLIAHTSYPQQAPHLFWFSHGACVRGNLHKWGLTS